MTRSSSVQSMRLLFTVTLGVTLLVTIALVTHVSASGPAPTKSTTSLVRRPLASSPYPFFNFGAPTRLLPTTTSDALTASGDSISAFQTEGNDPCNNYQSCSSCTRAPGCGLCITIPNVCASGDADGPSYGSCPPQYWLFGRPSTVCTDSYVCAQQQPYGCQGCALVIDQLSEEPACGYCESTGECLPGVASSPTIPYQCDGRWAYDLGACPPSGSGKNGGAMTAAGVGGIIIFIGIVIWTLVWIFLYTGITPLGTRFGSYWIPVQGSEQHPGPYQNKERRTIAVALLILTGLAKILALALDRWDRASVGGTTTYFGVFSLTITGGDGYKLAYGDYCDLPTINKQTCNVLQFGGLLAFVSGLIALTLNVINLGHALVFFFRPHLMPFYVFRVWRFAAFQVLASMCALDIWGGVAHVSLAISGGSGVYASWFSFIAAFILDIVIRYFYRFATYSLPKPEGAAADARMTNLVPASESSPASASSPASPRNEPQQQQAKFHVPSVMLYPSMPQPSSAQVTPVEAFPVNSYVPPPISHAPAELPGAASSGNPFENQPTFYSSYQPKPSQQTSGDDEPF